MRRIAGGFIYLAAGLVAGAFSAYLAIENAGVEPAGSNSLWLSRARGLAGGSDIYVRSHYLMAGRLPPALGQLVEATAETDADGQSLRPACVYRIASTGPLPKWWSLAVIAGGAAASSRQSTADSDSIIREGGGEVIIAAARTPQPGNWLKVPDSRQFALLYSATATDGRQQAVPPFVIAREGCP